MLKRYRKNRRIRRLKELDDPIIRIALQCLDRPTDMKEEFSLRQTLDLDTMQLHAETARAVGAIDEVVSRDIRLATLRAYCTVDAAYVFQCLAAMPELLNDQRATRSLHTYFNRIGQPEFGETLLGAPDFSLKKRPKRRKIFDFITPQSNSVPQQKTQSIVDDQSLDIDLKTVDLDRIGPRLTRYLAGHHLSTFINDVTGLLASKKMDIRRKREIVFQSGTLLLECSLEHALRFTSSVADLASDARLQRRLALELERTHRSEKAISLLSNSTNQTSQRLRNSIQERLNWRLHGYNLDVLKPVKNYQPVQGRVLYHIHASMDYTTAGYSTRTHHICKSLLEQGVDLHVRTRWGYPCDRKEVELRPEDIVNTVLDGVTYLHDPAEEAFGTYAMEDYAVRSAYSLLRTAMEIRPQTIHAASNHSVGFPAAMVARALNIPFVYEMRGLWALSRAAKDEEYRRSDRFQLEMALERHVANAADHVIAITDGLRAQLIEWGIPEEKISLAPNCVDAEQFSVQPRNELLERSLMLNGKMVVGYVGSLMHYEGLNFLLEAVALLPQLLRNNLAVLIVGDGAMRSSLENQAQDLGLSHMVKFTGKVPMDEVNNYYSLIDIAPFPRISAEVCEMISPLKPLEAMAMGSVVLASNVRAIAEHVIANKNGLLFEKENAQDLSEKLRMLIENLSLLRELSKAGRSWVEERRSWTSVTSVIASVYTHCHTSNGLLEWELDVLPSTINNGRLTGMPMKLNQLKVLAPTEDLPWLDSSASPDDGWQLTSDSIDLTPKLSVQSDEFHFSPWPPTAPVYRELTLREDHECLDDLLVPKQHDYSRARSTVFLCDALTTESEVHHAVGHGSILLAERTVHLQGYVGILAESEHFNSIVETVLRQEETHDHQRKENWRRRILKLHPWVRLVESAYDRSHLRRVDPMRYELYVSGDNAIDASQFVSQVLCQRVKPAWVTLPPTIEQTDEWLLTINALLVNGIIVHRNTAPLTSRAIAYTSSMNEHTGLDHCLNTLVAEGVCELTEPSEGDRLSVLSVNQRVLIVGHDLKFITPIANTWRSWGIAVTLLKSKTHSGDLDIDDQELIHLMSKHDVLFCEWALGNVNKISGLRGERSLSTRYHLQERNTEYLLDADLREDDNMIFVSKHTMEDDPRIIDPVGKIVVANAVDCLELDVERQDAKAIGLIGITPQRKRFDFALSILNGINQEINPINLILKGKLPKDFAWMKRRTSDNEWYTALFEKHQNMFEERLVTQEGYTKSIASYFSSVSAMLSVSDFESFHLAPLEGAAARTDVLMLGWTGATDIHKEDWIRGSLSDLSEKYVSHVRKGELYERGENNRQFVMENYELRKISLQLWNVIAKSNQGMDTSVPFVREIDRSSLLPMLHAESNRMWINTLVHDDNQLFSAADEAIRQIREPIDEIVILAAHMDLNLIDGSAIWFASMAEMLAATGIHVVCSIASEAESSPIIQPLLVLDNVTIITPTKMGLKAFGRKLPHDDYVDMVNSLATYLPGQTKVFSRGFDLVQDLSQLDGIEVWAYLTDYYRHEDDGSATVKETTAALVQAICERGGKILCQTSLIQKELTHLSGMPEHQFVELPPMIPNEAPEPLSGGVQDGKVDIVYAGKMAPLWGVEPLLDVASSELAVKVIGDKIHNGPADDATFRRRITSKLETNEHVDWIHRLPREEVLKHVGSADIAWCARDAHFEGQTRELSTKVLECILVGTPPILTRSVLHEELLGSDWPFFVDGPDDDSWAVDLPVKLESANERVLKLKLGLQKHNILTVSQTFRSTLGMEK